MLLPVSFVNSVFLVFRVFLDLQVKRERTVMLDPW